jgi:hypothetical protein
MLLQMCAHNSCSSVPHALVESKHVGVCTNAAGVEILDAKTVKRPRTRQCDVSLTVLERAAEVKLNLLEKQNSNERGVGVKVSAC